MIGYMLVWEDRAAIHRSRKAVMETFGHLARLFPRLKRPRIATVHLDEMEYKEAPAVSDRDMGALIGDALVNYLGKDGKWMNVECYNDGEVNVFKVKMSNGIKQGEGGGVFLSDAVAMARTNMLRPDVQETTVPADIVFDKVEKKEIKAGGLKLKK